MGARSPAWEARVLGQFPTQADDALISLAWLDEAARRPACRLRRAGCTAGLDVAGPGEDETVLVTRGGRAILDVAGVGKADPRGAVAATLAPYRRPPWRP